MVQKPSQVVERFKNLHTGDVAVDASPAAEAYVHDVTGTQHLNKEKWHCGIMMIKFYDSKNEIDLLT